MDKSMLDVALDCIRRGWYVFPCVPRDKRPLAGLAPRGFLDASNDEKVIRHWWKAKPDSNVGIATGASKLLVVDIDHGLAEASDVPWPEFMSGTDTYTYAVRTGRRPEFGLQLYFRADDSRNSSGWTKDGLSGDIRADGGYVLAAGSIHPSGEAYSVFWYGIGSDGSTKLRPVPDWVKELAPEKQKFDPATAVSDETAETWKVWLLEYAEHHMIEVRDFEKRAPNGWWLGIVCPWNAAHSSGAGVESSTVLGILDGRVAFECSHGTCKAAKRDTAHFKDEMARLHGPFESAPGDAPRVALGTGIKTAVADAQTDAFSFFDTPDQILNAEPVDFVINNVIPKNRYTGFVALSGSRKTIIACNLIRSALTLEPFLGQFAVDNAPTRVLFFAAESARSELKERIEHLGLVPFVQDRRLLIRSAATNGDFHQDQLPGELLDGALVIFDTFIRFYDGVSEQDATEARKFSAQMQRIVNAGATVIVLFHAPKGARGAEEMTIETVRGSSELGAAMAACWGLAMLGADWKDHTRMTQVKRREFQCEPPSFDFACDIETAICKYVEASDKVTVGGEGREEEDTAAEEYLVAHEQLPSRAVAKNCKAELGINRSAMWFQRRRKKLGIS